ncbi:MAG: copper resistance protein CopC [Beutenbergiaceae bacterium]
MTSSSRTCAPSSPLTLIAAFACAAVLWLVCAVPASAHSELLDSTPADSTELAVPPTEVVLEFNEEMVAMGTEVVVADPDGTAVSTGEPVVAGVTVTQAIDADVAGYYTVTWRTVSADGHPISGEFNFTVTNAAATTAAAEPSTSSSATSSAPPQSQTQTGSTTATATDSEPDGGALPWIIGAVVVAIGVAVALMARRRKAQ